MQRKHPVMTEERRRLALEMRERQGLGVGTIANKLGVSYGAVSHFLLREGVERKGKPDPNWQPEYRKDYVRNGRTVRAYTPQDDTIIREMRADGATYEEIAKRLGRKPHSIQGRYLTILRWDEREEGRS